MFDSSELAFRRYDSPPLKENEDQPKVAGVMWSPIKSGRLEYREQLYVSREGMKPSKASELSDRALMIIDAHNSEGKLVSQRDKARLALLEVKVVTDTVSLTFRADQAAERLKEKLESLAVSTFIFKVKFEADWSHPERATKVHDTTDIPGIDQGDDVAAWLTKIVGKEVRLMLQKPEVPRVRLETAPGFENLPTKLRFQDSFPVTALSYTTSDLFNQRLAKLHPEWPQFAPMHFRMNILLAGKINEHQAVGKFLKIGEVYLYVYRPKERCIEPAVDPDQGVMRGKPTFGSDYQTVLADMHDELGIPHHWRMKEVGKDDEKRLAPKPLLGVDLIPINEGYIGINDKVEVIDELPRGLFA